MNYTATSKVLVLKNTLLLSIYSFALIFLGPKLLAQSTSQNGKMPSYQMPTEALASSLELSAANKTAFLQTGQVLLMYDNEPSTILSPNKARAKQLYQEMKTVQPSLGLELLMAYPLPAKLAQAPKRDLIIYKQLQQFKTMAGISYWSASRQETRVFYNRSSLVDNPSQRRPINDPDPSSIAAHKTAWLLQEDSSFGNNLYSIRLQAPEAGYLELDILNWEQIWYGIVPVLAPKSLLSKITVSIRDGYLLFYGNTAINAARVFGLDERARVSFTNRIQALFSWFCGRLELEEKQLP